MERHDGIAYELVHRLDVPVPQMGEQLPNVVQFFSALLLVVAEPVIEVPKILPHDVPLRRLCRETQLAEQLVEVPTVLSYSSLQQLIVEQTVDIPVPGRAGGGGRGGLQGFPGQGSTASFGADRVDIPSGGLQGSRVQRLLQVFLITLGKGFFALFPEGIKCEARSALGVGTECGL